jgi:hypothetical protein
VALPLRETQMAMMTRLQLLLVCLQSPLQLLLLFLLVCLPGRDR